MTHAHYGYFHEERRMKMKDCKNETRNAFKSRFKGNEYALELEAAAYIRHLVPRNRSVLFHGTRHGKTILRENTLAAIRGTVCFTRQLHAAIRYAWKPFDDDEPVGAVFMLDHDKLKQTYHLRLRKGFPAYKGPVREAEETGYKDICNVAAFLYGVIWLDDNGILRPNQNLRHSIH